MEFVRLFLDPVDGLVGTGELADAAELPAVQVPEPAVGAAFRAIEFRYHNPPPVGEFSLPENPVRTDFCTEVATFAPGLVYGEFHVMCPMYVAVEPKKTYSLYAFLFLLSAEDFFRIFLHGRKEIVTRRIDPDHERQPVEFDHPDCLSHSKVREVNTF